MSPATAQPYRTILVPLDGSAMAESALDAARSLAGRFEATVVLLHILESRPPTSVHGDRHLAEAGEASAYLERLALGLRDAGLTVECHVHDDREGNVARSIVEHADEYRPDLVVLCTHGRSGLRDLLFGSIAQQALRLGSWPILLVHPKGRAKPTEFRLKCILVPVDPAHEYKPALSSASEIALKYGSRLHLLFVAPTIETVSDERAIPRIYMRNTMEAILKMDEDALAAQVQGIAEACRAQGLEVDAEVIRGDRVEAVLDRAEAVHADLIVLASHGRAGIDAILSGSVAPRITARTPCPLLLVRA